MTKLNLCEQLRARFVALKKTTTEGVRSTKTEVIDSLVLQQVLVWTLFWHLESLSIERSTQTILDLLKEQRSLIKALYKRIQLVLASIFILVNILKGVFVGFYVGSASTGIAELVKGFLQAGVTASSLNGLKRRALVYAVTGGILDLWVCYSLMLKWFPAAPSWVCIAGAPVFSITTYWLLIWGLFYQKRGYSG